MKVVFNQWVIWIMGGVWTRYRRDGAPGIFAGPPWGTLLTVRSRGERRAKVEHIGRSHGNGTRVQEKGNGTD